MSGESVLSRDGALEELKKGVVWDMVIIGGGATGLGVAVDAASRGYRTLLLEQVDFAKGTSSRSTKLVHGGVRYLAQGDVALVRAALRERGLLLKNAPHLVHAQPFLIPTYSFFSRFKYLMGLKMYDWLSGKESFGKSKFISRNKVKALFPDIREKGLQGGVQYYDGQFDDARLALNLAQTAAEHGAVVLNYMKVIELLKERGNVQGAVAQDAETGEVYHISSKTVINATGVFVDEILQMDAPGVKPIVRPSQGVHLVFSRSFLPVHSALMIPKTADGRVLFAVPWYNHALVGTTDTPLDSHSLEPVALDQEIDFILRTISLYFEKDIREKHVLSVFAGLRPLAAPKKETGATKEISRDHKLFISGSGLITITGGKWTTYRKMAEETVDKAVEIGLKPVACQTKGLKIHGYSTANEGYLSVYGSDAPKIQDLMTREPHLAELLRKGEPYTEAEVVWAARYEMARTVEDVLARRMRWLFLDAKGAMEVAPRVAQILAAELGRSKEWEQQQVHHFEKVANNYLIHKTARNMPAVS